MDWKAECGPAHATKKYTKEQINKQTPVSTKYGPIQDQWRQSKWNQKDYGGKDLWIGWVLSLEWKVDGMMLRAKVVNVIRWYVQDEVNQESEQNEVDGMKKGADSTGEGCIYKRAVGDL